MLWSRPKAGAPTPRLNFVDSSWKQGALFGVLQCDPEPALKSLAQTVTSEVGGLTLRTSPTGWRQAQGSVGNLQANLYAQSR